MTIGRTRVNFSSIQTNVDYKPILGTKDVYLSIFYVVLGPEDTKIKIITSKITKNIIFVLILY